VGYIAPGQTVEIVDNEDTPLPYGQEGTLRIRNEHMATEYINDPEATKAAFRNGWFYPGDLGIVTEDRMLVLSGREKSVLFIGTSKINPERIEAAALELPGVTQAAAFTEMGSHGIAEVWILVCSSKPIDVRAAGAHFARRLPGFCQPSQIIVSQQPIPVNTMGRFDRSTLPALAKKTLAGHQRPRPN
jgi:acyl-CoA synthetase (AMP-forming)/AMP-acid ligase II